MNKKEALSKVFVLENFTEKIRKCNKLTYAGLLEILSQESYNLKDELGVSAQTVSRYISILCPEKPKTSGKLCSYLLYKHGYKHCACCSKVYELTEFSKNTSNTDKLQTYCKTCQYSLEKPTAASRTAKYKASILLRTPPWVDQKEQKSISEFYRNCPEGYHVDHIVPLNGLSVCGLHVLCNLQYLKASDNCSKYNKFQPT